MADIPDYSVQPPPLLVAGAISSHDLAIADLRNWAYPEMTGRACELLAERKQYGLRKYVDEQGRGVVLHKDNGRDHPRDALDETLDLLVYLRTWMDAQPEVTEIVRPMYLQAQVMLVTLANWRANMAGERAPLPGPEGMLWTTMPLRHPANLHADDLADEDTGMALRWPDESSADRGGYYCGALQVDGERCIRSLVHDAGSWECIRHGERRVV